MHLFFFLRPHLHGFLLSWFPAPAFPLSLPAMKFPLFLFVFLTAAVFGADNPADLHELKINDTAPDFSLPGIDGKSHALAEYAGSKLLLVAFISNHCPDSHAAEARLLKLAADYRDRGLTVVAINPNNPDGLRLDELGYSKYNDGFDDMVKYATERHFTFLTSTMASGRRRRRRMAASRLPTSSSSMRSAGSAIRGNSMTPVTKIPPP